MSNLGQLAINGGTPVRSSPMPPRHLIGVEEKIILNHLIDHSIQTGDAFRYGGAYEEEYEREFVKFMGGTGFADGVNSGTNALFTAIGSLDLEPGSEIIVPALTDVGGITPILYQHLVPVMADTDARTYNIGVEQIRPLINSRTKAIVVAHISGEPAEIPAIMELARKHKLHVIEDCSQSHGAAYDGVKVGLFGDVSIFSTMSSKHHCTGGQGGVVFSKEKLYVERAKQIADRGKLYEDGIYTGQNIQLGLNCNMDELSAAIGCAQIKKLPKIVDKTHYIGETIKKLLIQQSQAASVGWQPPNSRCVYWFIRLKINLSKLNVDKSTFCTALAAEGIPVGNEYRTIPTEQKWYQTNLVQKILQSSARPTANNLDFPNINKSLAEHINIFIRESYGDQEIDDILTSIMKVEAAYAK
jgi:perosamine synthetase